MLFTSAELNSQSFYVVLHDVAPRFARSIADILDALRPLIGTSIAAAVVPCWHGDSMTAKDAGFVRLVKERFGDILLHGYHHRRANGGGLVSLMTGRSDELNGLSLDETAALLERGQAVLTEHFGTPASGFIAPTFQRGRLTADLLALHGLNYAVGFRRISLASGERIPIATWCWDMGRLGALGHAGQFYGHVRMRLYRNLLPCLALHPIDADRGFLPNIVALTRRLLDEGRKPVLLG